MLKIQVRGGGSCDESEMFIHETPPTIIPDPLKNINRNRTKSYYCLKWLLLLLMLFDSVF